MKYVINVLAVLVTIVIHELAHGYAALSMGDDTAKRAGRLSFNPLVHLSLPGFISMVLFRFGWAKPVPIQPDRFRHRRAGMILVSIAGVGANLVLAIIVAAVLTHAPITNSFVYSLLEALLMYNVIFCVFNLLPFPPLDGSKLVVSFFPSRLESFFYRYERYFSVILIVFIVTGVTQKIMFPMVLRLISFIFRLVS